MIVEPLFVLLTTTEIGRQMPSASWQSPVRNESTTELLHPHEHDYEHINCSRSGVPKSLVESARGFTVDQVTNYEPLKKNRAMLRKLEQVNTEKKEKTPQP